MTDQYIYMMFYVNLMGTTNLQQIHKGKEKEIQVYNYIENHLVPKAGSKKGRKEKMEPQIKQKTIRGHQ